MPLLNWLIQAFQFPLWYQASSAGDVIPAVQLLFIPQQAFPASVLGVILRGLCLMRPREIQWMFGGGAGEGGHDGFCGV